MKGFPLRLLLCGMVVLAAGLLYGQEQDQPDLAVVNIWGRFAPRGWETPAVGGLVLFEFQGQQQGTFRLGADIQNQGGACAEIAVNFFYLERGVREWTSFPSEILTSKPQQQNPITVESLDAGFSCDVSLQVNLLSPPDKAMPPGLYELRVRVDAVPPGIDSDPANNDSLSLAKRWFLFIHSPKEQLSTASSAPISAPIRSELLIRLEKDIHTLYFGDDFGNFYKARVETKSQEGSGQHFVVDWPDGHSPEPASAPVRAGPVIGKVGPDERIYFGSDNGKLYALSSKGERMWDFSFGAPIHSLSISPDETVTPDGQTIYLATDGDEGGKFCAVRDDGGAPTTWCYPDQGVIGAIRSKPAIRRVEREGSELMIYFGSDDGNLYALKDLGNSRPPSERFRLAWKFATGAFVRSSPAIQEPKSMIYFGSGDGNFYALHEICEGDSCHPIKKWDYHIGAFVISTPVTSNDGKTVYVGASNGTLYAFSTEEGAEGRLLWSFPTSGPIEFAPTIWPNPARDIIYLCSGIGDIHILNARGEQLDRVPLEVGCTTPLQVGPGTGETQLLYVAAGKRLYGIKGD